ncbi:hypothetical protein GCM10009716_04930 [Streptomyces sodiiphilus]|uniref:LysM domain-containing protein n=1 Tax=Streptomyces sodiiphilus TaxID=226217 RepID=A0ABP5A369_9ACTN
MDRAGRSRSIGRLPRDPGPGAARESFLQSKGTLMQFVRRTEWGAPATSPSAQLDSARGTKVHYLGTAYSSRAHSQCGPYVRQIRESHLNHPSENWNDIAYNLLACEHGYVFEGRGVRKRSGANGNATLNTDHYAICALLGASGLTRPPDPMLTALRDGIDHLRANGAGGEIRGHRDGIATACPGDPLYAWVRDGAPRPGGTVHVVREGETLYSIGRQYGVPWQSIAEANNIPEPYTIYPGQRLVVPGG